jgi:hypothetical protein
MVYVKVVCISKYAVRLGSSTSSVAVDPGTLCVLMPCRLVDVPLRVLDPEDEGAAILRNVSNAYQSYQSTQHDIPDWNFYSFNLKVLTNSSFIKVRVPGL